MAAARPRTNPGSLTSPKRRCIPIGSAPLPGTVTVVGEVEGLIRLEAALLDSHRSIPSVVLTQRLDGPAPVLPPEKVRAVIGPECRIYFVTSDRLLRRLRTRLGARLMVSRGAVRIFWPGLSVHSDSFAHPLMPVLDVEPLDGALAELRRQFDLTRPAVRQEIKLVEDARSVLEAEVTRLTGDLAAMAKQIRQDSQQRRDAIVRAETDERQYRSMSRPGET
jgi:hypothetical protein